MMKSCKWSRTLSAIVAATVRADLLILLSDIEGLYTADPRSDPDARLIDVVEAITPEIEALAASVPDSGGVYFVPALTGMGAPYWDQYAHGVICGITRGTTAAHIARAALEGIAFQTMDIVSAMERDAGVRLAELKVDGGASRNNLMMQFQADILGTSVIRPEVTETTAMGACYLAGLAVGYWDSLDEIRQQWKAECVFTPSDNDMEASKKGWQDAISRTLTK